MIRLARGDLGGAFMVLSRLPVGRWVGGPPDLARCVWAFPLVGLVIGALGALVDGVALRLGLAPLPAAGWALAAMILLTGGLHEDGLADTADGFGGGGTVARKLEIMRDSRIGSFGTLALVLSVLLRAGSVAASGRPGVVIIVAAVLGRAGMLVVLLRLAPARPDGLAAALGRPPAARALVGFGLAIAVAVVCLPVRVAVLALAVAAVGAWAIAWTAQRQIGGHTGDVLGAAEVVTECLVLSTLI